MARAGPQRSCSPGRERVFAPVVNGEGAEEVTDEIKGSGGDAVAIKTDVSSDAEVRAMVRATRETTEAVGRAPKRRLAGNDLIGALEELYSKYRLGEELRDSQER